MQIPCGCIRQVLLDKNWICKCIQADAIVCHSQEFQHEQKVFCVFSIDFHQSSLLCGGMKISQVTHEMVDKRGCHS